MDVMLGQCLVKNIIIIKTLFLNQNKCLELSDSLVCLHIYIFQELKKVFKDLLRFMNSYYETFKLIKLGGVPNLAH